VCICQIKKFSGVIPPDPRFKGEGREGKREGWIRRNGRKGMGRKERSRGRKGGEGREREGTEDSEGWCPLN
jgi:hypothetical protein